MDIGVIGLGNMGAPIARQLIQKTDHTVYGFDVVPAALEKLAADGGHPAASAEELCAGCGVVFLSLPSNALIREHLGLAVSRCPEGAVVVDVSSSIPEVIRAWQEEAAARGIALIDCPVSGGVQGAEQGTLSAMCGGDSEAVERVMPLLRTFAASVTHMGQLGSGYTAKLVNNLIVGGEITLLAEAFGLARRAGMDLPLLMEAIRGGAAGGPVMELKGRKMINGDYTPSSRVLIHLKDQHNAQEMARSLGADIPAGDLSTALLEKLVEQGRGNEDVACAIELF